MVAVLIYALLQPSLYETQATIIIRPMQSMTLDKDFVRALDTLGRGGEIGSTFVEIINSDQMKQTIINNLDIPPEMLVGLNIHSNAIIGTNILEVKVQGNDPKMVKDFADELTLETKARIGDIYGVFEIEPLDDFVQPWQPVRSNTEIILIGFILAVFTSIGLVLLGEFVINSGIIYRYLDFKPMLRTNEYFKYRLKQEISASHNGKAIFTVAMIKKYDFQSSQEIPWKDSDTIPTQLNEEEVFSNFEEAFGIIFPGKSAYQIYRDFISNSSIDSDGQNENLEYGIKAGVVQFNNRDLDEQGLTDLAFQTIADEVGERKNKVYYYTNIELSSDEDEDEEEVSTGTETE
jgi:capsular polysaccharide biosynthesis protein